MVFCVKKIIFKQTIEAKNTMVKRRSKRHDMLATLHHASKLPGGMPLSLADLLEWHSHLEAEKKWDPQASSAIK